jgi:hypothetical protein
MTKLLKVLAVFLVAAALPAALIFAPEPRARWQGAEPQQIVATVEPSPLSLVCAGAAIRVGGEAGTDVGSFERLAAANLQVQLSDPSAELSFESANSGPTTTTTAESESLEIEPPTVLTVKSALPQSTELFAAWQFQELNEQRIAGTLASNCDQPERVHWFVAGNLGPGDDSLLSVYNPNRVEVSVTLRVYAGGRSQLSEFALAPKQNELISLATLASGNPEFAVELVATGRVASWLQHRSNRGLSATGVALVSGQRAASQAITIPSLLVRGTEIAPFPELLTPVIRIFNPGTEPAEVLVEVVRAAGGFGTAERVVVNPGQIHQLSLAGLTDGDYAAFINSSAAVLAGAYNPVVLDLNRLDFAWLGASEAFEETFVIPVGNTPTNLVLTNPAAESVSIGVTQRNQQRSVRLPARSVRVVELVRGSPVTVSPSGSVHAALQLVGVGYAVVQPTENRNIGSSVVVRVQ